RLYPLGKGPAMNPPAPPGADRTAPAGGVELTLRGAAPGIDKTRLARLLRDGGHEQDKSIQLASLILAGREVRVRLGQFDTPAAARAALREIGVEEVLA